ncbi:MAG: SBBP repeat-containing protein [Acidobacteriia bacterium]|nr:SBBP repeat-containing protein [Terriglobia bacterium]
MKLNYRGLGSGGSRSGALVVGAILVFTAVALVLGSSSQVRPAGPGNQSASALPSQRNPSASGIPQIRTDFSRLPLAFERNQGQSDPRVKFLARGSGYGLFLTGEEAVLALQSSTVGRQSSARKTSVLTMGLVGASPSPVVTGTDVLPGKSNYFIGNDPAKWHRNVPQFARVRYQQVYPGIDLVYYGNQGQLEYDFEVAPGADPAQVALKFRGSEPLQLDAQGNLVLASRDGDVRLKAPRVYQKFGDVQRPVRGHFALRGKDQVGFEVGAYDRSRELVIDPVLTYSSYLGGNANEGCLAITGVTASGCPAIAVDSAFNIYVAGPTTSTDFPLTPPPVPPATGPLPYQSALKGGADVFVTKLDPTGSTILFSTYLGGSLDDTTAGLAVDAASDVYVAGNTLSNTDFPVTPANAPQVGPLTAANHVFASELSPDGSALLYSTYLGGDGVDTASGLALDFHAKMYLTGTTTSTDFPTTATAFQLMPKAASQFFITKLDPVATSSANSLAYSTYLGGAVTLLGAPGEAVGGGIFVDANTSNVFVTGGTTYADMGLNSSQTFISCGASFPNCRHAIAGRFDLTKASSAQELFLTYLGGTGDDVGYGIAVDGSLDVYITGSTTSPDVTSATIVVRDPVYPTTVVPFQPCLDSASALATACPAGVTAKDAFVAKFTPPCVGVSCTTTNVPLVYFSYLGGSADDIGYSIVVDPNQGARITGSTASNDFHLLNNTSVQAGFGGGPTDAFAARIDTTATTNTASGHFSTYLGGSGADSGTGIALDSRSNTYLAGETASGNFPTLNPFQPSPSGGSDAFVTKLGPSVNLALTVTPSPAAPVTVGVGNEVTFKYTITNNGDAVSGVSFTDILAASGSTLVSTPTASPGTCSAANGGTVLCNIGTLNGGGIATITVLVTPTVGPTVGNSGQVTVAGSAFAVSASSSATVNDFSLTPPPAPSSVTVDAGKPATYQVMITPTATPFPNSVGLSCTGAPTGATCNFTTRTFTNLDNGAVSTTLNINTTVRPTPVASLFQHGGPLGPLSAAWLPVSGLALLGVGIGRKMSRKRRLLGGLVLGGFLALLMLQAGCGTSSTAAVPISGTPAGTYPITITATSGTVPHSATVQLVVK